MKFKKGYVSALLGLPVLIIIAVLVLRDEPTKQRSQGPSFESVGVPQDPPSSKTESSNAPFVIIEGSEETRITTNAPIYTTIVAKATYDEYELHAYDSNKRHTGILRGPGSFLVGRSEEQIPNSSYELFGDSQYLVLDTDGAYRIEIHGKSNSDLDVILLFGLSGDTSPPAFEYKDIPVTSEFQAYLLLPREPEEKPRLFIDNNGDEAIERQLDPTPTTWP